VKALVVGAGRMGLRHVRGLREVTEDVCVVDPREEARREAGVPQSFATLEAALEAESFDAVVLAETAAGRLERLLAVIAAGVPSVLVEKPLEQSRERVRAMLEAVRSRPADVRVNHFFRTLAVFASLRPRGGPFHVTVVGGAFGLACNGIHWIDLARHLSGDGGGRLLFGELDETPIGSGRGEQFRDFGGRALFGFDDGSRLFLSSDADSSAPMQATIVQPATETVLLPHDASAVAYRRDPASATPPYLYGAGYERSEGTALESDDLWRSTASWARGVAAGEAAPHPSLEISVLAHELLFDLLERSGEREFAIT
jgi:Oxidoreductase family, NAD-binding Rossmann fold